MEIDFTDWQFWVAMVTATSIIFKYGESVGQSGDRRAKVRLADAERDADDAKGKLASCRNELKDQASVFSSRIVDLERQHAQAMADLETRHAAEVSELQAKIAELEKSLSWHRAALEGKGPDGPIKF